MSKGRNIDASAGIDAPATMDTQVANDDEKAAAMDTQVSNNDAQFTDNAHAVSITNVHSVMLAINFFSFIFPPL